MNFKPSLDKNKTYVLACSYGPDSMFLLNALCEQGYKFVVAHVNYHKRKESNFEQASLEKYCGDKNIPIEVLDTTGLKSEGNFQAWAREIRYDFFKKVCEKYNANTLLVAHHQDDHLETYLIQQKRGGFYMHYGINESTTIKGMNVIRPMLSLPKKEIVEFNDKNNIPYSIDSSNLTDIYQRNKFRNHYLKEITDEKRYELLKEIDIKNKELDEKLEQAKIRLNDRKFYTVKSAKKLNFEEFAFVVFKLMEVNDAFAPVSKRQLETLKRNLNSNKANIKVELSKDVSYYQEYGEIRILRNKKSYCYTIEKPCLFQCEEFTIDLRKECDDRNIHPEDFPITIRCKRDDDKYLINDYYVKLSRLFLDWKMPLHLRDTWPVVVNKDDRIIYIPRYRRVFIDHHKTMFKISLK